MAVRGKLLSRLTFDTAGFTDHNTWAADERVYGEYELTRNIEKDLIQD